MAGITLTLSSPTVELKDGKGSLTASVTNSSVEPERVVLGAFPAQAGAPSYTVVDEPLRTLGPGATEQYLVSFDTTGAAPGSYLVKLIAYSADDAPEDYADQAHVVTLTVPAAAPPPPQRGFPWLWVIIGGVVLLLAMGGVVWFLLQGSGGNVPDVRGKQQAEAARILIDAGFSMGSTEVVSNEAPGTVVSQNPEAGGTAAKGSTVSVEIARAADIPVPNVIGQRREDAEQALLEAGFRVAVQEVPGGADFGMVKGVLPEVGTPLPRGSQVTLQVATLPIIGLGLLPGTTGGL
ncbi:hypothetical protein BIU82_12190 [Arthrobacter sp. SW1]|uniref:PASTA domain-containing protein n=1 Tax=Arthrobacter sp. SW1 TaxID=1920889 RepID=UPI000877D0B9|nr:PASTA domain-containing protein [Arthrobacter sp. SW1]OFI36821.1 hypothetical protein BIU82_12190 [Arthrobacter sp. SW1]